MNALAALSPLEQSYEQARDNFEHIVGYPNSEEASSMTHSELERELEKKGRELMRIMLQGNRLNSPPKYFYAAIGEGATPFLPRAIV